MVQPKPAASSISSWMCEPITNSFFGTHPRITQIAAHPVFLGDHDLGAVAGRDAGGANPARTAPDDEQIDVELSHFNLARENACWNQISLPRFFISARNWALTVSAKTCAHWFI